MKSLSFFLVLSTSLFAKDAYIQWATAHWSAATVSSYFDKNTQWGEEADPDDDGLPNLLEYACDTDPLNRNASSDCYQLVYSSYGTFSGKYPQLFAWIRTDDPELQITAQTSVDSINWMPYGPNNVLINPYVTSQDTNIYLPGLKLHNYVDTQPMSGKRESVFMRLVVRRKASTVKTPSVTSFSFTNQVGVTAGSIIRSNSILLAGFSGKFSVSIPEGVTLFVNGAAVTNLKAEVKAGDTLWMQTLAPNTPGATGNYTLTIGGRSSTWSFTVAALSSVPDHTGSDSGYAPVEAGVSDTGAAQISMPIVISPGTGGMQPSLSINYSSQGGNGPLGVGFSLTGLSSISRVGRTVAQDGVKGGVNFDANDRFALDGQRLIAISGADGADGTEYRLEFDPTTRVRSYASNGYSPAYWTVETKSGLVMRFGESSNSQIRPVFDGKGVVKNDWYEIVPARSGVAGLIGIDSYPNSPKVSVFADTLEGLLSAGRHCGQRMRGYLVPKVSGTYQFQVSGRWDTALNFNPNGISDTGLIRIADNGVTSSTFNLVAGQKYLIEALHYRYTGEGYIYPYWKGPGIPQGPNGEFTTIIDSEYLEAEPLATVTSEITGWSLAKTTDTLGNTIRYTYDSEQLAKGVNLISKINYTENFTQGLSANGEVSFHYADRPDIKNQFYANNRREQAVLGKILSRIETRQNVAGTSRLLRSYDFTWGISKFTQRSILRSVRESAGSTQHDTSFEWADQTLPSYTSSTQAVPAIPAQWNVANAQAGDFNGDGRTDLFSYGNDGSLTVLLKKETAGFDIVRTLPDRGFNSAAFWLLDANSDGCVDLVTRLVSDNSTIITYRSDGVGGFTSVTSNPGVAWNTGGVATGDINGDGRTDFVSGLQTTTILSFLSKGDGSFVVADATQGMTDTANTLYQGDFNGDGMMDFVSNRLTNKYEAAYFLTLYISKGDGSFTTKVIPYPKSYGGMDGNLMVGDFNGDSLSDLAKLDAGFVTVFLMDGEQVRKSVKTPHNLSGLVIRPDWVGSFNSDESADLFGWDSNVGTLVRLISLGDGSFNIVTQTNPSPSTCRQAHTWLGDFDGDGKSEPISENNQLTLFSPPETSAFVEDYVVKVTNNHGGETRFNYAPLTSSSVHTKSTGLLPPNLDMQPAMYVVSSITARNGIDGDAFTQTAAATPGMNTVSYRYEGAWSNMEGRGFMGFKAVETLDVAAGITSRTEYDRSSPLLAGRAKRTVQRLVSPPPGGSSLISVSDTTWVIKTTTRAGRPNTYFVSDGSSVSNAYEVNRPSASALIRTVSRSASSYDDYANLLKSTTTTTAGTESFTETVTNTYADAPTPTKWHLGRLATSTVTKTGPDPAGTGTQSLSRSSSFNYHPTTGLLTQEVIEPAGGALRQQKDYTHDGFGNILTSTISTNGAISRTTTTTYTPDGRFVATTTNAAGHTESKTYDPLLGNVLTQTGPNGLTTRWEYDAIGRPIKETRPDGTVTRSFYRRVTNSTIGAPPRAVHYVRVQSSGGAPKTVWYDLLDREIRADGIAFDGRTVATHKVFNNRGEVTHSSQPFFIGETPRYSTMIYDKTGRVSQQNDPGNRITKNTYDGLTETVERNYNPSATNQYQKAVTVVNAMGWTVQSSQFLDNAAKTITRRYDPYGNLRFVIDPAGNSTEIRYDLRGNKIWMREPNSGASTFTYNGFGELLTQTNAAKQTVRLTYDKLGRVLTRTEPEGVSRFEYDTSANGIGQLARESSGDFVRIYYYDRLCRPVSTVESHASQRFVVSRSYDSFGRPDTLTYPTGFATRQIYTSNGHLQEVQNAASSQVYWRALTVNSRGQITLETQGNGVITDRVFDADSGLIKGIASTFGRAGDIQDSEFDFDLIGNLTARRDHRFDTPFSETFSYDTLNRLQTVTTTGAAAVTATYNDLGNITARTDVGNFSYGSTTTGPHALTGVTGGSFNKKCSYDVKGNRITDGATKLTYSSYNKPVSMVKGGDSLRFAYGPDRALYRQTTNLARPKGGALQTVREYIGGLYERETISGGLVRHIHYIAGGSGVAAILTDERSASTSAQRLRYIHKDHLGSVDVITDSAGAVVERQSFDAWGRRRTVAYNSSTSTWIVSYPAKPGSAETNRGFTGHEMLDAVGLVHMGGRIYDPITARFLSPDPFVQAPDNLQNLNRYSYVLNNPLSYTDPSGFFFKSIGKFIGKHWKTIAAVGIGLATGTAFLITANSIGVTSTVGLHFAAGAGIGFGSAFSGTLLAGGSVGDALRAGLGSGLKNGLAQGALGGVDLVAPDWLSGDLPNQGERWITEGRVGNQISRIGLRGIIRGTSSWAQGGSFGRGAAFSTVPDLLKWGQESIAESRYRTETNPFDRNFEKMGAKTFDKDVLRGFNVDYSKGRMPNALPSDRAKMELESVIDSRITNPGRAFTGTGGFWEEGGPAMRALRTVMPGLDAVGRTHDPFVFWAGIQEIETLNVGTNLFYIPATQAALAGSWNEPATAILRDQQWKKW